MVAEERIPVRVVEVVAQAEVELCVLFPCEVADGCGLCGGVADRQHVEQELVGQRALAVSICDAEDEVLVAIVIEG